MPCVIVAHEMRFARNVASKVVFLAEKGIYEQGTPKEVFDNPRKPLTQRFLYRSRMYEKELLNSKLDLLSLYTELKQFVSKSAHRGTPIAGACRQHASAAFQQHMSSCQFRIDC